VDVTRTVLAIDGGGSKTDVVLVRVDGSVLAHAQGPSSQPQTVGLPAAIAVLDELVAKVAATVGRTGTLPVADHAAVYLAGLDLPQELAAVREQVDRRLWGQETVVANDTFALLRAGTESPDAVAVVCGTGINCVGRNAAGATTTFPALGILTGDWGGGYHLGQLGLWHGARAEDGRGEATSLQRLVTEHFGYPSVQRVGEAMHLGELDVRRIGELSAVVLAAATDGDLVAGRLVDRLAEEIALLVTVSLARLGLQDSPADVVLGGGVARARHPRLLEGVETRVRECSPDIRMVVVDDPPVVGAALLGLDRLSAPRDAGARLRQELSVGSVGSARPGQ
jgi:N-acetylglucosamine kinase-like BadF-type ATPase